MEKTHDFNSISKYNDFNNQETLHPLVSIIDFSNANKRKGSRMNFGLYCIFLKEANCGHLMYGCNHYDYQDGTLVFVSPGQVIDVENKIDYYQPIGHGLAFHPDLIKGTSLMKGIHAYNFFSYSTHEALHISVKERKLVLDCFNKINTELKQPVDKHSRKLIASNVELFLNYCERFYDRQFITRENVNKGILERFEALLNDYFISDKPHRIGLPSVVYCADELHLSSNYFGDLIKKETGRSPKEYIQFKLIDTAKENILDSRKSINEIAYGLGFKYPQHFSRLFKKVVGQSPIEYRRENLN